MSSRSACISLVSKGKWGLLVVMESIHSWMKRMSSLVLCVYLSGAVEKGTNLQWNISSTYTRKMVEEIKGKVNSFILTLIYEQPTKDQSRRDPKDMSTLSTNIRVNSLTYLLLPAPNLCSDAETNCFSLPDVY